MERFNSQSRCECAVTPNDRRKNAANMAPVAQIAAELRFDL
jgi:hypothetical protein